MVDVSIIIVSYNTAELLENCINSIVEKTQNISYEVIVVDNDSCDNSIPLLYEKFDWVKVIVSKKNLGFGRANNLGIEVASGRNILFLNSDTILINNAIKILSEFVDGKNGVGACCGNLFDANCLPTQSFTRIFPGIIWELNYITLNIFPKLFYGKNLHFNYSGKNIKVARVSGADMMVPKRVLDVIGSFDPAFFLYSEETDLAYRITRSGYKIMSIYDAQIIHLEGQSCSFSLKKTRWGMVSRNLFLRKRYKFTFLVYLCNLLHYLVCLIFLCRNFVFRRDSVDSQSIWYEIKNLHKSGSMNY